jgi:hypothetical protein
VILAAGAALPYGVVLADSFLRAGRFAPAFAVVGLIGGVLLALALVFGAPWLLGWSLLIAGAVYIGVLEARGSGVDGTAPLVATGLFLCAELARWSFDMRVRISGDELLIARRAGALVGLAIGAAAASTVVVGVTALGAPRDLAWTALGAAAAAGATAVGVWLARR